MTPTPTSDTPTPDPMQGISDANFVSLGRVGYATQSLGISGQAKAPRCYDAKRGDCRVRLWRD